MQENYSEIFFSAKNAQELFNNTIWLLLKSIWEESQHLKNLFRVITPTYLPGRFSTLIYFNVTDTPLDLRIEELRITSFNIDYSFFSYKNLEYKFSFCFNCYVKFEETHCSVQLGVSDENLIISADIEPILLTLKYGEQLDDLKIQQISQDVAKLFLKYIKSKTTH